MPEPLEIRVVEAGELRVESRGGAPVIRGDAIVYNRLSEPLGAFRERMARGGTGRPLGAAVAPRPTVDQNREKPLGRLSAKTLRVESAGHGLRVEIDPPQ